jgi:ribosomal protein L25 (general stress protein Ctc)
VLLPSAITLNVHEIGHLLENEEAYTSVLELAIDKKVEPVVIKDLQRHPAKNLVQHDIFCDQTYQACHFTRKCTKRNAI